MEGLLVVKLPVNLRCSVATVKDIVLRATIGALNSNTITTVATNDHVSVFVIYPFSTLNSAVTACNKRGINTKGCSHLTDNVGSTAVLTTICSTTVLIIVVFLTHPLVCLFVTPSSDTGVARIITRTERFLVAGAYFCVLLSLIGVIHFLVRKVNFSNFTMFTNMFRVVTHTLVNLVFMPVFKFATTYFTDPLT